MVADFSLTLHDPRLTTERQNALHEPHILALTQWVSGLKYRGLNVPWFDPADGGIMAELLILLQSPAASQLSPRFVSQDNPNPAQKNLKRFLQQAGINRRQLALWNTVPWISDQPKKSPGRQEIVAGIKLLETLLPLFPRLQVIVLAGAIAAQVEPTIRWLKPDIRVFIMPHPSPLSVCTSPAVAVRIQQVLAEVSLYLEDKSYDRRENEGIA